MKIEKGQLKKFLGFKLMYQKNRGGSLFQLFSGIENIILLFNNITKYIVNAKKYLNLKFDPTVCHIILFI